MAKQRLGKGLNALIPELPQIEDQECETAHQ